MSNCTYMQYLFLRYYACTRWIHSICEISSSNLDARYFFRAQYRFISFSLFPYFPAIIHFAIENNFPFLSIVLSKPFTPNCIHFICNIYFGIMRVHKTDSFDIEISSSNLDACSFFRVQYRFITFSSYFPQFTLQLKAI